NVTLPALVANGIEAAALGIQDRTELHQVDAAALEVLHLHIGRDCPQNRAMLHHLPLGSRQMLTAAQVGRDLANQRVGLAIGGGLRMQRIQRQQSVFLAGPAFRVGLTPVWAGSRRAFVVHRLFLQPLANYSAEPANATPKARASPWV